MPLFFNGFVHVQSVETSLSARPVKSYAVMAVPDLDSPGTQPDPSLEEEALTEIMISCWPDISRDIEVPVEDCCYLLEGKWSYSPDVGFVVEATRFIQVPPIQPPIEPRLSGTVIFKKTDSEHQNLLHCVADCFAATIKMEQMPIQACYVPAQYTKFIAKLKAGREISISGVISYVKSKLLFLKYCDFSFLSRQSEETTVARPVLSWPKKSASAGLPSPTASSSSAFSASKKKADVGDDLRKLFPSPSPSTQPVAGSSGSNSAKKTNVSPFPPSKSKGKGRAAPLIPDESESDMLPPDADVDAMTSAAEPSDDASNAINADDVEVESVDHVDADDVQCLESNNAVQAVESSELQSTRGKRRRR